MTTIRERAVRSAVRLSVASIVWSGLVGGFAVGVSLTTGGLSLLGFGVDAVVDALTSVVLVWRFYVEVQHPERAARVERLAEWVVGAALVGFAVYLGAASLVALRAGHAPSITAPALVLLLASLVVLPPLALFKYRVAQAIGSAALRADSALTFVSAGLALLSLLGQVAASALGLWWADSAGALLVTVVVLHEGCGRCARPSTPTFGSSASRRARPSPRWRGTSGCTPVVWVGSMTG